MTTNVQYVPWCSEINSIEGYEEKLKEELFNNPRGLFALNAITIAQLDHINDEYDNWCTNKYGCTYRKFITGGKLHRVKLRLKIVHLYTYPYASLLVKGEVPSPEIVVTLI